jgi:uncharacterized coiled-coil protein SlyX
VNGPIRAKSLTLSQTGWPDYVFDSSYRLMTLQQVERYIHTNRHLPGITSAAEIEKEGLSVGDIQSGLLKKIEELTLYSIDQEKKISSQEKQLDEQAKMLAQQQQQIELFKTALQDLREEMRKQRSSINNVK